MICPLKRLICYIILWVVDISTLILFFQASLREYYGNNDQSPNVNNDQNSFTTGNLALSSSNLMEYFLLCYFNSVTFSMVYNISYRLNIIIINRHSIFDCLLKINIFTEKLALKFDEIDPVFKISYIVLPSNYFFVYDTATLIYFLNLVKKNI